MTIPLVEHSLPLLEIPLHTVMKNGRQEWRLRGNLHRLDGPAVIDVDGTQQWFVDGKWHRLDGPAIIWDNGYQSWYVYGTRHRLDGPAVIFVDGSEEWWIDGHNITHLSAHAKLLHIRAYAQMQTDVA